MAARRPPVAKGGIWTTQQAPVSKDTQKLLKVMMEESKLTNFQRRQLNDKMTKGQSLPVSVNPTTSRSQQHRQPSSSKKPLPKVMNAKHLSGGRRSKDDIAQQSESQDEEHIKLSSGKYISREEKRRLQNIMAYGEYGKDIDNKPKKRSSPAPEHSGEPDVDRFDEVLQEIEDRKQFLEEMEALGQGVKYRTVINTEISQKIRELELIDKQRSRELDFVLQKKESPNDGS